MIFFGCIGLEMAGAVTTTRITSVCLFNMTDSCCMAATVESTNYENGAIGTGFCKSCASCFDASIALSDDDGK